jgi:glycosyltransferase involved in cell wall biosynthesis
MKICITTHNFPCKPGESVDAGVFVADLAEELTKIGQNITVFCPDIKREKVDFPHFRVKWFNWAGGDKKLRLLKPWNPFDLFRIVNLFIRGSKELIALSDAADIDMCLAMWAIPAGYFANRLKHNKGVPYSVWVLGSDIWTYTRIPFIRGIIKKILIEAQFLFADGIELCKEAEKISGRNCIYMRSGRHLSRNGIFPVELDKSKKNFLFIGRWEKYKGIDLLIETAIELLKENMVFNLYVFGGGSLEKHIKNLVKRTGTQNNIIIGGYISAEALASYLAVCDALIIPSRKETFAIVLLDALQMDTPVIVTNVGEMGQLVAEYHVGIVAERAVKPDLKAAMASFMNIDGREFKANMGILRDKFSIDKIARQLTGYLNNESGGE